MPFLYPTIHWHEDLTTMQCRELARAWCKQAAEMSGMPITDMACLCYGWERKEPPDQRTRRTWAADFCKFLAGGRAPDRMWAVPLCRLMTNMDDRRDLNNVFCRARHRLPHVGTSRRKTRTALAAKVGEEAVTLLAQLVDAPSLEEAHRLARELQSRLGLAAHLD